MATKDVLVDVPLLPTLQENKDRQNVKPPGFLRIEDAYLDREGALRKRDGAALDTTFVVESVTTPSFVASYNDDTAVGTSEGVHQFAPGKQGYNNTPSGDYDAIVDHLSLSGVSGNIIEVDSAGSGDRLFVAFTTNDAGQAFSQTGTKIWFAVFDAISGESVRIPFEVAVGATISRPRVVLNGSSVSFWWLDGGIAYYTAGVPGSTLAGTSAPFFSVIGTVSATDICWCPVPTIAGGALVFTIDLGVVTPWSSALASLASWTAGPTNASTGTYVFVSCRRVTSQESGGIDSVYVCSYESNKVGIGPAFLGEFLFRRFDVALLSWVGSSFPSHMYGSPADPVFPVPDDCYEPQLSRLVVGSVVGGDGVFRVVAWGTCYWNCGNLPGDFRQGAGCCTTVSSLVVDPSGFSSQQIQEGSPYYTYAITSHPFAVVGKKAEAVMVSRSGFGAIVDGHFRPPTDPEDPLFVVVGGEDFSSCVAMCPVHDTPAPGLPISAKPVFKAFDLRVPPTIQGVVTGQDRVSLTGLTFPFSLGRPFVPVGESLRVVFRTRVSRSPAGTSGQVYLLEMAKILMQPEAQGTVEENGALFGRNMFSCFDGATSCESSIIDPPITNRYIFGATTNPEYDLNPPPSSAIIGEAYLRVVYAWEDAQGNIHRSGPSPRTAPQGPVVGPSIQYQFTVFDYPISMWGGTTADDVFSRYVELYRETDGVFELVGRRPYESGARLTTPYAVPHLRVYLFSDYINNAIGVPEGMPTLYTEGGVLESQSPPSFKDIESGKGRIWGLTDSKLFYTKPVEERVAPEWNYALTLDIPDDTGKTVGIGSMDDKVVAFTERGTYVVYGDGPNALGSGGTFAQLLRIPGNIGCIARGSIVECPLGIAFLSQQGFYLLDRGLNLAFIGKPVESSVDALIRLGLPHTIVSAVHDIGNKHVRFIVDSSMPGIGDMKRDHYVWYYETNQWGRFTSFNELQSVYSRGRVLSLFDRGVVAGQRTIQTTIEGDNLNGYGDFAAPLVMAARTGWIDLGNIEGFERVKRFNFLYQPGYDTTAPNTTRQGIDVKTYTEYRTTPADSTHSWDESDLVTIQAPIDYAGEFSVQPRIQKCASMSIEFEEQVKPVSPPLPKTYQGTTISGLTMRIGKRRGVNKMNFAAARRK